MTARRAREHNDANVLALGGRHQRRLDKIAKWNARRISRDLASNGL